MNKTNDTGRFKLYFLMFFLLLSMVLFTKLIASFISPVIISFAFTTLLYPIYKLILKKVKNKKNLASLLTCLLMIVTLIIPLIILFFLLSHQITLLYQNIDPFIKTLFSIDQNKILSYFQQFTFYDRLEQMNIDWQSILLDVINKLLNAVSLLVNKYSQSVLLFVVDFFISIFCCFYFFRDGDKFLEYMQTLSPLQKEHDKRIFDSFSRISRATVKGTLLIGLLQGSLGALTLLLFGIKTWALWGFVMVLCAIIPVIGAWVVLVPAAIIQLIIGNYWQGISIFFISTLIISNVDNLVRPYLVGKDAKMHDLLIFFSTIGGIGLFGIMGFIIGPVIASIFLSLLNIYKEEFKEKIEKM